MTYLSVILADSPLHHWGFDGATPQTDTMGTGNLNAYQSNGITLGRLGWGLLLSNTNTMTTTPSTMGTSPFSYECWFKVDNASDPSKLRHPFISLSATTGSGNNTVTMGVYGAAGTYPGQAYVIIESSVDPPTQSLEIHSGTQYAFNDWHHMVVTRSGTSFWLYVDGILKASTTSGLSSYTFDAANFNIGWSLGGGIGSTLRMNGVIDEIAQYNTTLSAARVLAHYNAAVSPFIGWGRPI